jgi:L-threonylcarbamoyladenylate synthase
MEAAVRRVETVCLSAQAPDALDRVVIALRHGELAAFPTDTVYGVGAHAFLPEAVLHLYAVKERPAHLPIPLLLPDVRAMEAVCVDIPALAWELAQHFWPGGLSLVLRRAPTVPDAVTAGASTVAVRVPDHPLVRELCRRLGVPLAATSANLHGQPDPITAAEVGVALGGRIPLILDGGPCPGGVASTVLDLTVSPPVILRRGPVTDEQLAAVVSLRSSLTVLADRAIMHPSMRTASTKGKRIEEKEEDNA